MPRLVHPSATFRDSYLAAAAEFAAEGRLHDSSVEELASDFAGFVAAVLAQRDPATVAPERVPQHDFWLVDDDQNQYLGRVSVRPELNEQLRVWGGHIGYEIRPSRRRQGYGREILHLVLPQAKRLGLSRVLVTCDHDNVGSRRIIEANGGIYDGDVEAVAGHPAKRRYWIELG